MYESFSFYRQCNQIIGAKIGVGIDDSRTPVGVTTLTTACHHTKPSSVRMKTLVRPLSPGDPLTSSGRLGSPASFIPGPQKNLRTQVFLSSAGAAPASRGGPGIR